MNPERVKGPRTDERQGMESSKGAPSLGEPETARPILGAIPYPPYKATLRASIARRLSGGHQGCIGKTSSGGHSSSTPMGTNLPLKPQGIRLVSPNLVSAEGVELSPRKPKLPRVSGSRAGRHSPTSGLAILLL